MPVTAYIEKTEALLEETKRLLVNAGYQPQFFSRAKLSDLDKVLSRAQLPAAAIVYGGSTYQDRPRRIAQVAVVCRPLQLSDTEETAESARAEMDAVIAILDEHILENAIWRIRSDQVVESRGGAISYVLTFDVEDH